MGQISFFVRKGRDKIRETKVYIAKKESLSDA